MITQTLWPHQEVAIRAVMDWVPGESRYLMISSPTGSGKTKMMEEVRGVLPGVSLLVTPSLGILRGFYREATGEEPPKKENAFRDECWELGMATPLWLRNRLDQGDVDGDLWEFIVLDEAHHSTADTYELLEAYAPGARWIGFTATPFRGTPAQTEALYAKWGKPVEVLTYPKADARYITLPTCHVVPLVDDDLIEVKQGKFTDAQVVRKTEDSLDLLKDLLRETWARSFGPTMVAVPTREILWALVQSLPFTVGVDANVSYKQRAEAFEAVVAGRKMLIQISAVSEGIDLPLRCLVDARPLYSPVAWCQMVGRITRLSDDVRPVYICTNRNLERHAYIWQGAMDRGQLAQAQNAFVEPSKRVCQRALGLELLRRRKPAYVAAASGVVYPCVPLAHTATDGTTKEWLAVIDPAGAEDAWFTRTSEKKGDQRRYGRWERTVPPETLTGYSPGKWTSGKLSPKMEKWFNRDYAQAGFHPGMRGNTTRKEFTVFAALMENRLKLR